MKKYNLQLPSKNISLGELVISVDESRIKINLAEESKDYRKSLIRLINTLKADGEFKIEFGEDDLEIMGLSPLFIEALKQELMRRLEIYLEKVS